MNKNLSRLLITAVILGLVVGVAYMLRGDDSSEAASETSCTKLNELYTKFNCGSSGQSACTGIINAIQKSDCPLAQVLCTAFGREGACASSCTGGVLIGPPAPGGECAATEGCCILF